MDTRISHNNINTDAACLIISVLHDDPFFEHNAYKYDNDVREAVGTTRSVHKPSNLHPTYMHRVNE